MPWLRQSGSELIFALGCLWFIHVVRSWHLVAWAISSLRQKHCTAYCVDRLLLTCFLCIQLLTNAGIVFYLHALIPWRPMSSGVRKVESMGERGKGKGLTVLVQDKFRDWHNCSLLLYIPGTRGACCGLVTRNIFEGLRWRVVVQNDWLAGGRWCWASLYRRLQELSVCLLRTLLLLVCFFLTW